MTQITFDQTLALSLYQSNNPFPIDLDIAWQWLGYGKKQTAKDTLKNNFEEGLDFSRTGIKSSGGRPSEVLMLSIDCFKMLGMIAGTEQGKAIRKYFLECERIAKAATKPVNSLTLIDTSKLDALTTKESKLQEMQSTCIQYSVVMVHVFDLSYIYRLLQSSLFFDLLSVIPIIVFRHHLVARAVNCMTDKHCCCY
ncbi:hypothetical protein [Nostoc sp.]|uniref:hypothetical protein n=1 Tax=Nostoc sp. TaxID=1180 RepID=UPI002FFBE853